MNNIELGYLVKDKLTGFVGVAENRANFLYGVPRYCVQPLVNKDGTVPESVMIDVTQLEYVPNEPRRVVSAPEPKQLVELGSIVYDPIRCQEGTATGRAVYLNGCSRIYVEPKYNTKQKFGGWWVDEPQLEVKRKSFSKEPKKVVDVEHRYKATGGPARSSSKY